MSTILESALAYASGGIEVFPVPPGTKHSYKSKATSIEGKNWGATKNADIIRSYWAEHPDANLGVPTGADNGFWVLEYDTVSGHGIDGAASLAALEAEFGPLPATRQAESPSGSVHFYFQHPGYKITGTPGIRPGIDIRGDGNMVLAPPSVKLGVGVYRWLNDLPVADAPQWLLDLLKTAKASAAAVERASVDIPPPPSDATPVEKALHTEYHRVAKAPEGARNHQLNKSSFELGRFVGAGELDEEKAIQSLVNACEANGSFAEAAGECQGTIDSGIQAGKADPVKTVSTMFGGVAQLVAAPQQNSKQTVDGGTGQVIMQEGKRGAVAEPLPEHPNLTAPQAFALEDFVAYLPGGTFCYLPTREMWPASGANAKLGDVMVNGVSKIKAATWLSQNRAADAMAWCPGEPMLIKDRLLVECGWIAKPGDTTLNNYRPPTIAARDGDASIWLNHIKTIYPEDWEHIVSWFAHRVQRPGEKINHALVLGGEPGVGKDSLLEPIKPAVGAWNFCDVSPANVMGRFNSHLKSIVLRISEVHDLGEIDRFAFYDRTKTLCAAPPDTHRIDEKNMREYQAVNVTGVIMTTNHKAGGLYLPPDDRRHYVAWSPTPTGTFAPEYFDGLYGWFRTGGNEIVAHYLATLDISAFNAKAPPLKTPAFWEIVQSARSAESADVDDALDALGRPDAITLAMLEHSPGATHEFRAWLGDRKNGVKIAHRMTDAGYAPIRNPDANDGQWRIGGKRRSVYGKRAVSKVDQLTLAAAMVRGPALPPPSQMVPLLPAPPMLQLAPPPPPPY